MQLGLGSEPLKRLNIMVWNSAELHRVAAELQLSCASILDTFWGDLHLTHHSGLQIHALVYVFTSIRLYMAVYGC